jgi:hypothetical protein
MIDCEIFYCCLLFYYRTGFDPAARDSKIGLDFQISDTITGSEMDPVKT